MRKFFLRSAALTAVLAASSLTPQSVWAQAAGAPHAGAEAGAGRDPGASGQVAPKAGSGNTSGADRPEPHEPRSTNPASGSQRAPDQGERNRASDHQGDRNENRPGDQRRGAETEKGRDASGERRGSEHGSERAGERRSGERADSERGGHAERITSEQRTRVRTQLRGHGDVLRGVDFAIGVGTIVPSRYHYRPLPPDIIEFLPEYRGYDYILVDDEIIILEPGTRRIVDVID